MVIVSESGTAPGRVSAPSAEVRQRFRTFQEEFAPGMYYTECTAVESDAVGVSATPHTSQRRLKSLRDVR